MKIDKRNCPVLFKLIQEKSLNKNLNLKIGENNIHPDLFESLTPTINECLGNIMYLTRPIVDAFDNGPIGTIEKLTGLRNEIKDVSRTVIWKHDPTGVVTTTLYRFIKEGNVIRFFIATTQAIKNKQIFSDSTFFVPLVTGQWEIEWERNKYTVGNYLFSHVFESGQDELRNKYIVDTIALIVQCEVFLQYAQIETKTLNKNTKDSILCRYENKLSLPVTIVDSTWYTNLIKSDGFKVRGHFRLQPYKEGKRLIWINDFEKYGYTREAKKLQEYRATV